MQAVQIISFGANKATSQLGFKRFPRETMRIVAVASIIGVLLTLLLLAGAYAADSAGHPDLAGVLFWHNGLLQSFIPLYNIGTAEQPIYEGTPLNVLGFLASIPLGFVIYGVAAYAALRLLRRGAK